MKKFIFILFIFPITVFGQSSLGIKAGATLSSIGNYTGYTFHLGPNLGLIYSNTINKFQITVEPSFNQKGYGIDAIATYPTGGTINWGKISERMNYFDLPITFGWVPFNDKLIFGIHGGLVPCILLSSKFKAQGYSSADNNKKFGLDIVGGAKIGGMINDNTFLTFNLRYGTQLLSTNSNINGPKLFYINSFIEIGRKF